MYCSLGSQNAQLPHLLSYIIFKYAICWFAYQKQKQISTPPLPVFPATTFSAAATFSSC